MSWCGWVCRRAQDSKSEQLVAVKNLRVGRDLESAKRALREVEMLKHFMGSENVRCVVLRKVSWKAVSLIFIISDWVLKFLVHLGDQCEKSEI